MKKVLLGLLIVLVSVSFILLISIYINQINENNGCYKLKVPQLFCNCENLSVDFMVSCVYFPGQLIDETCTSHTTSLPCGSADDFYKAGVPESFNIKTGATCDEAYNKIFLRDSLIKINITKNW